MLVGLKKLIAQRIIDIINKYIEHHKMPDGYFLINYYSLNVSNIIKDYKDIYFSPWSYVGWIPELFLMDYLRVYTDGSFEVDEEKVKSELIDIVFKKIDETNPQNKLDDFTNLYFGSALFDCQRDINIDTWLDDNLDYSEKLNEEGIMYSLENSYSDAPIDCFKKAVELGNIDAMFNGFNYLWSWQRWDAAILWMKQVNNMKQKNIKCLWNEMMLRKINRFDRSETHFENLSRIINILEYIEGHPAEFTSTGSSIFKQKVHLLLQETDIYSKLY